MNTIHFYITLKHMWRRYYTQDCSNTICFYIILKRMHIPLTQFEYHILLHHSQTNTSDNFLSTLFEYHILLHHSQTWIKINLFRNSFEYHILLHHSQTRNRFSYFLFKFEYHILLHHSQTSNSKMNCHHLHKAWYSNTLINFTSVFIYNITNPPFQASPFLVFDK